MSDVLIAAARSAWTKASATTPGARAWRAIRIGCPGHLAVLAGIRATDDARALLFETSIENAPQMHGRFEADGISMLEERNYPERIYRIAVALERPDLDSIFEIVAADLMEAASTCQTATAAIAALFMRLSAWQAFLQARRSGLGRPAVVGLTGELLVLRRLAEIVGWPAAVGAWIGPAGGLHDFACRGIGIETKTSCGVASLIDISSLDQLDDTGLSELLLAHIHLSEAATGFHLPGLVAGIAQNVAAAAPAAMRTYLDALLLTGYAEVDAGLYLTPVFQIVSKRFFSVGPLFPRLIRRETPDGIAEAHYRLDVRALQAHLIDDTDAATIMRQMGDEV